MSCDLFISYSTSDREFAEALDEALRMRGIDCWIAGRSIAAGDDWRVSIVEALTDCRAVVVVFSTSANASQQVGREIEIASDRRKTIIPLRLDDSLPTGSFEYYLRPLHWLNASDRNVDRAAAQIARSLASVTTAPYAPLPAQAPFAAPHADAERAHNIPESLTTFIGRAEEVVAVRALVAQARLVTLIGPGGSGKTRLASQVGLEIAGDFPDGAWLVELAPVADPELVLQSIADVLDVRESAGKTLLQSLTAALAAKTLLVILDNCEHLVAACADAAQKLLAACRGLKVLATSREALGAAGEQVFPVPPLEIPAARTLAGSALDEFVMRYDSVKLFVDRAVSYQPTFRLSSANAGAVARVCRRLDGIPLALELAAARVKVLSAEQVADRLDDRFRLLTAGARTALPRQRTLRATIDWSYDLLSERERLLLVRLAVLSGCNLTEAETICADDPGDPGAPAAAAGIEGWEVLDLLSQLIDKSLVQSREVAGEARYLMLESLRQYGWEKLEALGEAQRIKDRHMRCFLKLAEQARPHLTGPDQAQWLLRLDSEIDNLRAAVAWCRSRPEEIESEIRIVEALSMYWIARGYITEGRGLITDVISRTDESAHPRLAARALQAAGVFMRLQGDYAAARIPLERSLEIVRGLGDRQAEALDLRSLGNIALQEGDHPRAEALYRESLAICREIGDEGGIAAAVGNLGLAASYQGRVDEALQYHAQSLKLHREQGNLMAVARTLDHIGIAYTQLSDLENSRPYLLESLEIRRQMDDRRGLSFALANLGANYLDSGRVQEGIALTQESLALRREQGDQSGVGRSLENLSSAALDAGDLDRAKTLCRESLVILSSIHDMQAMVTASILAGYIAAAAEQWQAAADLLAGALYARESLKIFTNPSRSERFDAVAAVVCDRLGIDALPAREMSVEALASIALAALDGGS